MFCADEMLEVFLSKKTFLLTIEESEQLQAIKERQACQSLPVLLNRLTSIDHFRY